MQVTVDFQPIKCGEFKKDLTINYDSSESVNSDSCVSKCLNQDEKYQFFVLSYFTE